MAPMDSTQCSLSKHVAPHRCQITHQQCGSYQCPLSFQECCSFTLWNSISSIGFLSMASVTPRMLLLMFVKQQIFYQVPLNALFFSKNVKLHIIKWIPLNSLALSKNVAPHLCEKTDHQSGSSQWPLSFQECCSTSLANNRPSVEFPLITCLSQYVAPYLCSITSHQYFIRSKVINRGELQ